MTDNFTATTNTILRNLSLATDRVSKSLERLSTGLRINRASDDAAGLHLATGLQADRRVYAKAIQNVNDGISMLNMEDAALAELNTILAKQRELASQASNDLNTLEQRTALNNEVRDLTDEFNRIVETTEFNGRDLLAGASQTVSFQAGYGEINSISFALASTLADTVGDGTFSFASLIDAETPRYLAFGDFNGDLNVDVVATAVGIDGSGTDVVSVMFGNGNGTFGAAQTYYATEESALGVVTADFNGDGFDDFAIGLGGAVGIERIINVFINDGAGGFAAPISYFSEAYTAAVVVADVNNDGALDILGGKNGSSLLSVYLGNEDGTFSTATTFDAGGNHGIIEGYTDLNGDGNVDLFVRDRFIDQYRIMIGNGDGTFNAALSYDGLDGGQYQVIDVNDDGIADLVGIGGEDGSGGVFFGNGDGTFGLDYSFTIGPASPRPRDHTVGDFNGDGIVDLAVSFDNDTVDSQYFKVFLGQGDGTFGAGVTQETNGLAENIFSVDVDNDGILDLLLPDYKTGTAQNQIEIFTGNQHQITGMPYLRLFTAAEAEDAIEVLDDAINRVAQQRGETTAMLSRLSVASTNLSSSVSGFDSAISMIMDVDIAEETAQLVRNQMLQSSSGAMLAQANQSPQMVVKLLTGLLDSDD